MLCSCGETYDCTHCFLIAFVVENEYIQVVNKEIQYVQYNLQVTTTVPIEIKINYIYEKLLFSPH